MIVSLFDKSIRVCFTNFWYAAKPEHYPFLEIIRNTCPLFRVVKCYKPHIEIFSAFGDKKKLLDSRALIKIFFTGENVNRISTQYIQYQGNCVDTVDLSMGFDPHEAENYIRYPLWLLYFFPTDSSRDAIQKILKNFNRTYKKSKFCTLIARHDKNGIRTRIYNSISEISHVDSSGKLLHNDDTLRSIYNNDKNIYLQQYKFNICPENSINDGYVTEKIFQSLYSGCIPIYNGWSRDPEPGIINPNIIMWYDESDEENNKYTMNEVRRLHENDKLYRSFIEQPFFCDTAVDKIYNFNTQLNLKMQGLLQKINA